MQKLHTKQNLANKLTFQQINFIKLLQISSADISSRIIKEIEDNPLLEQTDEAKENNETDFSENTYVSSNSTKNDFISNDKNNYFKTAVFSEPFRDNLISQLRLYGLRDTDLKIGKYIIGSIDDNGYLRCSIEDIIDEFAFKYYIDLKYEEVEKVLKTIQNFEPVGIGARDLRECLLIQLSKDQNRNKNKHINIAATVLKDCFKEFVNKHFNKICTKLEISYEELKLAIEYIKTLNPKPIILEKAESINTYINPDFIVSRRDGELFVSLSKENIPDLRINNTYNKFESSDANAFIRNKINSARWFIEAIKQRQKTMLNTMNAIVKFQKEFFEEEEKSNLKPMILKDIAEAIGMDVSTISRVVNNKYVQTDCSIYPLKLFFSESIKTTKGEEVSSREVKEVINTIIEKEDKQDPYTDEKIADILNDKGYKIARRTVSKYREQLKIPVTRLRRDL